MNTGPAPRLEPLIAIMQENGLDAAALIPGPNFMQLFGRDFHLMERPLVVLVTAEGQTAAIVPSLEAESFSGINLPGPVFTWRDEDGYSQAFAGAADTLARLKSGGSIGVEAQRMRVFEYQALAAAFPGAAIKDAHEAISSVRLRKPAEAISHLRDAIAISEAALEATLSTVRAGQTEADIASTLKQQMFAHGADGLAFDPIVAAGGNAAEPHAHVRDDYRIRPGDALLIDFGASRHGYHADITRTFFVGEVADEDRALYETVLEANEAGRAAVRAGITAHDVDDAVQAVLERSAFSDFIVHKTGHGLGLEVHEAPQIMRGNGQVLEAGMVFTIEPGLYRSGRCGVRIEDDVVVTDDGIDCLTSFSRVLRIVG